MTQGAARIDPPVEDSVSDVLKWVLLFVAIVSFGLLAWATVITYRTAPPQPDRYVTAAGLVVMTDVDITAGKGGFQRADLMDYGSLYGMGSYFGEDYTASNLVALATLTQTNIAITEFGKPYAALRPEQQWLAHTAMQSQLQGIDLTAKQAMVPPAVAAAITTAKFNVGLARRHVLSPTAAELFADPLNAVASRGHFDFPALVYTGISQ